MGGDLRGSRTGFGLVSCVGKFCGFVIVDLTVRAIGQVGWLERLQFNIRIRYLAIR